MAFAMRKYLSVIVALTAPTVAGCGGGSSNNNTNTYAIPVAVTAVAVTDLSWVRTYNGSLEGIRQAEPTATLSETITALRVTEGDEVTPGQVIIEFDKYGPSTRLRQAEAAYLDARRNYEKFERLFEGRAVSERERDYAETQYKIAKADYEAARDQVLVKSPIAGIVTDIYVKMGQQARLGQVLTIERSASVYIRSELDTSITAEGWVQKISESADPATRTVTVDVLAANPQGLLGPGMYVTGEILLERREQILAVPGDALVTRNGQRGVFIARDSVAHFAEIKEGLTVGNLTQVVSGVAEGDLVVVLGQQSLHNGTRISTEITE